MTFKVLQCNTDPHKNNQVVHKCVVVPHNSSEILYNSALAPKSDAYFPDFNLQGETPIKPAAPEQRGTVDTPYISILEGGGKTAQALKFIFGRWYRSY